MRPTDFCFPSLDYEHPYLVGFRPVTGPSLVREPPRCGAEDSVFHDTDIPLRRALRFSLFPQSPSGRCLPRDDSQDRASDTPVASFDSAPNGPLGPLFLGAFEGRLDRLSTAPVKGPQHPRSGVPSIGR